MSLGSEVVINDCTFQDKLFTYSLRRSGPSDKLLLSSFAVAISASPGLTWKNWACWCQFAAVAPL